MNKRVITTLIGTTIILFMGAVTSNYALAGIQHSDTQVAEGESRECHYSGSEKIAAQKAINAAEKVCTTRRGVYLDFNTVSVVDTNCFKCTYGERCEVQINYKCMTNN